MDPRSNYCNCSCVFIYAVRITDEIYTYLSQLSHTCAQLQWNLLLVTGLVLFLRGLATTPNTKPTSLHGNSSINQQPRCRILSVSKSSCQPPGCHTSQQQSRTSLHHAILGAVSRIPVITAFSIYNDTPVVVGLQSHSSPLRWHPNSTSDLSLCLP